MQEEKAVLPSQFPKVSLLKHSLPQGEERKGERKKGRRRKRDGRRGGLKRVEHKGGRKKKKERGSPTGQSKNKLKEPL